MPRPLVVFAAWLGTLFLAALVALAVARLLRPSFCTFYQQVRVWSAAFLASFGLLVFAVERQQRGRSRAAAVRALLVVGAFGLLLSFVIPSTFGAVSRSRQLGTKADLRALATAIEAARGPDAALPTVASVAVPESLTGKSLPERDRWGNSFLVRIEPTRYVIVSFGECGVPDQPDPWAYRPGVTHDARADIVLPNGKFWRYPEGLQND